MAKTVKEAKADIFLRDTDTQSLFNNSGVLLYKYYHEWNDCYNSTTGETAQINGEVYDEGSGTYKPNCPSGYDPVFNGRLSALWDNLTYCFSDDIKTMYQKMRENGLSYKDMLTKYKDFWKYLCENLYNADAFGYANTNNFTKAYGDKVQVVDYFFNKRQRYLDSKYNTGLSTSNNLRFRLYEKGNGFALKYYQAIYSNLHWGSKIDSQRNIKPGEYSYMPFLLDNPQNATFDIDDTDLITELSTYTKTSSGYTIGGLEGLGDFYFDQNMILLKRLTKFVMNYTVSSPNTLEKGTAFDLSGMKMLKQVIVRNVTGLSKSIVLSSDLLEEVDFTGTPITGLSTPPTDMLTKLVLPDTIKSLNLVGYTNIQPSGLQIGGYSNIETLDIEDCPNLDSYSICKACYDAGAKLSNVTLTGIDWQIDDVDFLLKLADKKANFKGKITISDKVTISAEQKVSFVSAWGNIDNKSNSLYISYDIVNIKSVSIAGIKYLDKKEKKYAYKIRALGNNLLSIKWSISENKFASIDKDSGVVTLEKVGNSSNKDKATISVSVELSDGTFVNAEKEIYFYKKEIALGDYVFADGTYGDELSSSDSSPIGIVFYIEPKNRKWAMCIALADYRNCVWGLYNSTDGNNGMNGITLGDDYIYDVYDLVKLPNIGTHYNVSNPSMRDEENTVNDGFKDYGTVLNTISDIGFDEITDVMYNQVVGKYNKIFGEYLDAVGLSVGDKIARGQLYTLYIIAHRDKILQDSKVNLPVPKRTSEQTLAQNLASCISAVMASHSNAQKYQQYYYPAASYCNAYVPKVSDDETLDERFGEGRWFLPSIGEMSRFSWYLQQGYTVGKDNNIFAQAYTIDGKFKLPSQDWHWSASEFTATDSWFINPVNGAVSYYTSYQKCVGHPMRPVAAFRL